MARASKAKRIDLVWDKYIVWAEKNNKSWNDDKIRWEKHVEPFVKDRKMDAVTKATVRRILGRMEDKGRSPQTIKQVNRHDGRCSMVKAVRA